MQTGQWVGHLLWEPIKTRQILLVSAGHKSQSRTKQSQKKVQNSQNATAKAIHLQNEQQTFL